jgi:hypothetical protein
MNPEKGTDQNADISPEERELLDDAEHTMPTEDEQLRRQALPDRTDEDGELLNEETGTGSDLDVPGSEDDDAMEDIGEEDEENNYYA